MMVYFRKRLDARTLSEINDMITGVKRIEKPDDKDDIDHDGPESKREGKLQNSSAA